MSKITWEHGVHAPARLIASRQDPKTGRTWAVAAIFTEAEGVDPRGTVLIVEGNSSLSNTHIDKIQLPEGMDPESDDAKRYVETLWRMSQ